MNADEGLTPGQVQAEHEARGHTDGRRYGASSWLDCRTTRCINYRTDAHIRGLIEPAFCPACGHQTGWTVIEQGEMR